ncbi:uncharacterized protein LOC119635329 [Glossina fuscipes]|uniref:Uncharacterized protein LOC119635329 n=1 Tax=Glossina fuscipes TaxID=7396 RepID=A0A8U0WLR9_9MUSC|nr:uncharacterized protein LOC119635329 [Glossina fuscipes]KAI9589536.1 hypothetical protein GQX74_007705 [Glossina fuscipes]
MFDCCGCLRKNRTSKNNEITSESSWTVGQINKNFETAELSLGISRRSTLACTLPTIVETPPSLISSVRTSMDSDKMSKIDMHINIFEDERFSDMSATIFKKNNESLSNVSSTYTNDSEKPN